MSSLKYKVAAIQASPSASLSKPLSIFALRADLPSVMFNAAATTAKTVELLHEAAKEGAKLVVFPELWIPGYPFYLWMYPYGGARLSSQPSLPAAEHCPTPSAAITKYTVPYYENSVLPDGPEAILMKAACKKLGVTAVIGVSEREHGSLYMAQWIIGPDGEFIARRRKIKPSIVERLCFGEGDVSCQGSSRRRRLRRLMGFVSRDRISRCTRLPLGASVL